MDLRQQKQVKIVSKQKKTVLYYIQFDTQDVFPSGYITLFGGNATFCLVDEMQMIEIERYKVFNMKKTLLLNCQKKKRSRKLFAFVRKHLLMNS